MDNIILFDNDESPDVVTAPDPAWMAAECGVSAREMERRLSGTWMHGLTVGSILVRSWGYDQTNVDFFEVVAVRGAMVRIREVAAVVVESHAGAEYLAPRRGIYTGDVSGWKRPSRGYKGSTSVKVSDYGHAYLWDGRPEYQTAGGYGH